MNRRKPKARRQDWKPFEKKSLYERWRTDEVKVETWFERDRAFVGLLDDEAGEYLVEWWDDDAAVMFEDGFFKQGPGFEESVIKYAESMDLPAYPK